jgi:hypothetical protein
MTFGNPAGFCAKTRKWQGVEFLYRNSSLLNLRSSPADFFPAEDGRQVDQPFSFVAASFTPLQSPFFSWFAVGIHTTGIQPAQTSGTTYATGRIWAGLWNIMNFCCKSGEIWTLVDPLKAIEIHSKSTAPWCQVDSYFLDSPLLEARWVPFQIALCDLNS